MSRPVIAFLVASVVATCTGRLPAAPAGLAFDGDRVTLPLERADDYLLVPVRVGDADAGLFIVDTGFSFSVVDRALADELQLPIVVGGKIQAVGGRAEVAYRVVPSLTLGRDAEGTVRTGRRAITAMDMTAMWEELGSKGVRGFLGGDVLRDAPFTLDWRAARLTFHAPRSFVPPEAIPRHPILLAGNRPLIRMSLETHLSALYMLDTGSNGSISLDAGYAASLRPVLAGRPVRSATSTGGGGVVQGRETTFATAEFLGAGFADVAVDYSGGGGGGPSPVGAAGLVGWDLLRGFRLTFDYAGRSVWAERTAAGDGPVRPVEWDAPGFGVGAPDASGLTPLMRAARLGLPQDVNRFLTAGADVTAASGRGTTALHDGARSGNVEVVAALLAAGAPVDVKSRDEVTPLQAAAGRGNVAVVNALIVAGADHAASDVFGRTALMRAAERSDGTEVVVALLAAGADPNVWSPSGTALHFAAGAGDVEIVRALLAAGADPNAVATGPAKVAKVPTALVIAASWNRSAVLSLLLERGADPNVVNAEGRSALHWAVYRADAASVMALLAKNADPALRDRKGETALEIAAAAGSLSTDLALTLHDAIAAREAKEAAAEK